MWFLVFVLVASGLGIAAVLIRNRRPTSMEASINDFERSLDALAPEHPSDLSTTHPERRATDDRGDRPA